MHIKGKASLVAIRLTEATHSAATAMHSDKMAWIFILGLVIFVNPLEAKHGVKHYTHISEMYTSDKSVDLTINCSETVMKGTSVYWKKEGQPEFYKTGPQLQITMWGPPDAGVFTCWNGIKLLSRHAVFIMKKTSTGEISEPMLTSFEEHSGNYINCITNSYSGNFTCSWMLAHHDPDLKFAIITGNNSQITCDEPMNKSVGENSEYTVSCTKEHSCPSAEEYKPITIILKVFHNLVYVYEEHTNSFFIKDIIKPDASECQIAEHDKSTKLTWRHPKTWSTPESYFRLKYQIATVRHNKILSICEVDDTTLLRNGSTLSCYVKQRRGEMFYIRSRDHYNENGAWSNWSEYCRSGFQKDDKPYFPPNQEVKIKEACKCQRN